MKVASLFSGGKDSTYSIYVAQQRGWEVATLVTIAPRDPESRLYHVPNVRLAPLLSECLGIPLRMKESEGGEAEELRTLASVLSELDVEGLVMGTIESEYQRSRMNAVCHDIGLRCFTPLWRRRQPDLLDDYLSAGFEVVIVGVAAEGLDASWLGRELDPSMKDEILSLHRMHGLSPCGEGGEYETLVLDGPNFTKRLRIIDSKVEWTGKSGSLTVTKAEVCAKQGSGAARI